MLEGGKISLLALLELKAKKQMQPQFEIISHILNAYQLYPANPILLNFFKHNSVPRLNTLICSEQKDLIRGQYLDSMQ